MAESLAVWLYGFQAAVIEQQRGRLRLAYTPEALNKYPLGFPLLSMALPLAPKRYSHGVVSAFIDGLLPEGDQRRVIADDLDLKAGDTYSLIRCLGRDCAGALIVLPSDQMPPPPATVDTAIPLTESELGDMVTNLRHAPLGIGARVRLSLAGVQEKLVLTRMRDGSWGSPVDNTPSTHILKPEIATLSNTVENEAFCMRVAKHLGLPVAGVETMTVNGRRLIAVERYDRLIRPDGTVERIHQEDFCQALGIRPAKKYEEDGGPSLRRMAQLLDAAADADSREALLRATTLNVLLGNGDAHGKNFSLLHDPRGSIRLAPLYDLMCTLVYDQDRLAMCIDSVTRTKRVTTDRLVLEAVGWGLAKRRATDIIIDVLDRAPSAADAAANETGDVPASLRAAFDAQHARLTKST